MSNQTAETTEALEEATDRIYETFKDAPRHPSHYEIVGAVKGYHKQRLTALKERIDNQIENDKRSSYKSPAIHRAKLAGMKDVLTLIEEEIQ